MLRAFLSALFLALPVSAQESAWPFASFDLASDARLMDPHDLAIGNDGRLYVADKFGGRIAVLDAETLEIIEFLGAGVFPGVHDISFGADGSVAIAITGIGAVAVYPEIGAIDEQPDFIVPAPRTEGALLHSNGRLYAMASGTGTILAYDGDALVAAAQGYIGAHDIEEAPNGDIWVADNANARLVRLSPDLEVLQLLNHEKFGLVGPRYLDIDDFGRLIVADQDAHRILMIDPAGPDGGTLVGVLGDGIPGAGPNKFDDPEGVAVLGSRYYFSDSDNNRIVRYSVVLN